MVTTTTPAADAGTALTEQELRAWRGFLRVHAALVKALDADLEAAHDMPLSSYEVLLHLDGAEAGRMRMCTLAESVILSRSGLTRLVDRLERDGLIAREPCEDDARGSYAVLTQAGREKLAAARATHLAGVRSLFLDNFGPGELDALGDAWEHLLPGITSRPGPSCG
jgi:DNA-binding MarR family transcriptional regulator